MNTAFYLSKRIAVVTLCFLAFILQGSVGSRAAAEEPAEAKKPATAAVKSAPPEDYSAFEKKIYQAVKEFEYPDAVAQDFVALVRSWNLPAMEKKLAEAADALKAGKSTQEQCAAVEKEVVEELAGAIKKTIAGVDTNLPKNSQYFSLTSVVRDKKSQCVGFLQLFYLLGEAIGLKVDGLQVWEHVQIPLQGSMAHVACKVNLADGKNMQVDLTLKSRVSDVFSFEDAFEAEGSYWKLKKPENFGGLHRRVQILDKKGVQSAVCGNRGLECAKNGKLDAALDWFNKAVELNPRSVEAYVNRGKFYCETRNAVKAMPDLNKAIELNPRSAAAYVNRSSANGMTGKFKESIADADRALELEPRFADAFNNRGIALLSTGKPDDALRDFNKAIEVNPNYLGAYVNRGAVYMRSGKADDAIADFSKVIELKPNMFNAYMMRGMAYAQTGKKKEAAKDLNKASALNPRMKEQIEKMAEKSGVDLEAGDD